MQEKKIISGLNLWKVPTNNLAFNLAVIQTEATKHKVGKMRCKCQQTAGHPPAPLNSSVTKQTSKTNMAFALWEPHYATCPSGSSQGVYIVSEPLLPRYVFIKKRSGSPIQKTWAVSLQLCPLTVWPWQKQSHLATRAKWKKKTLCWETVRCLSEREYSQGGRGGRRRVRG